MLDTKNRVAIVVTALVFGAAAGYFYDRWVTERAEKRLEDEDEPFEKDELVYGYEAAVKRANEKMQKLKDDGVPEDEIEDGVKAIGPMPIAAELHDKSSINEGEVKLEVEEQTDYHKIASAYSPEGEVKDDPRPELPQDEKQYRDANEPVVKPWPDDKEGDWFEISEDKYLWEDPWMDKLEAMYDVATGELDANVPQVLVEVQRRCCSAYLHDNSISKVFFRNTEDEQDIRVTFQRPEMTEIDK